MTNATINRVIEEFGSLAVEEKEYVRGIFNKQLVELGRERIFERANKAKLNLEQGLVKSGSVEDLREDLFNSKNMD